MAETVFLRLLAHDDKPAALAEAVDGVRGGRASNPLAYAVDPASFPQVPGSPFAYWVSERIRRLFTELPPFDNEAEGRATRCGLGTTDNFRFLRLNWEVHIAERNVNWLPYYDGGVYSPVYDLFPLVVWWQDDGRDVKEFVAAKFGSASRNVRGEDFYKRPGFIFPRRTRGLCPKVMAADGIFSNAGQAGFVPESELLATIGFLTSEICTLLISLSQGRTGDAAQFEVGLVKRLPWVAMDGNEWANTLSSLTREICNTKRRSFQGNEASPDFIAPDVVMAHGDTLRERISQADSTLTTFSLTVAALLDEINTIVLDAYGLCQEDRLALAAYAGQSGTSDPHCDPDHESEESIIPTDLDHFVCDLLSYAIGCAIGRWDIRFGNWDKRPAELPDPLAPMRVLSPGMLQSSTQLPLNSVRRDYPLRIDWDGILVDDEGHQDDIVQRVRDVLEVIWDSRQYAEGSMQTGEEGETAYRSLPTAYSIEREACEILGVKTLRDYFKRPGKGGFWDDHVKRYSKSRRKAPIYWLLQSSKKNYALWLYYHRLDKDMLFKALLNYVEPKVQREENRLADLRSEKSGGESGKGAKKLDREIEKQEDLLSELRDFAEKLRRAADLHLVPDLNDGVVLNIAPLHELVPWKEAKKYWEELTGGKYEWSSIGKQLREKGLVKD